MNAEDKMSTIEGTVSNRQKLSASTFVQHRQLNCTECDELPSGWCRDIDNKTPRYVGKAAAGSNLQLHSVPYYTHRGFEQCLANKTIVFIGDSRVRYQFLNLLAFLKEERFMNCADQRQYAKEDISCFLIDREWKTKRLKRNWNVWYKNTTRFLNEKGGKGKQMCDCFRHNPLQPNKAYENRFVERRTSFGTTRLIFLLNFLNNVRMGSNFPPFTDFDSEPKERCEVGECGDENRTNLFEGDVNATMWEILPRLNATHAFVQLGWDHHFRFSEKSQFSCAVQHFQQHHPDLQVSLISHPIRVYRNESAMECDPDGLECDVPMLDRTKPTIGVPVNWYWDKHTHVLSILNEEFNHQLLKQLCPIE